MQVAEAQAEAVSGIRERMERIEAAARAPYKPRPPGATVDLIRFHLPSCSLEPAHVATPYI